LVIDGMAGERQANNEKFLEKYGEDLDYLNCPR
jgi:hypothetical protein